MGALFLVLFNNIKKVSCLTVFHHDHERILGVKAIDVAHNIRVLKILNKVDFLHAGGLIFLGLALENHLLRHIQLLLIVFVLDKPGRTSRTCSQLLYLLKPLFVQVECAVFFL